MTDQEYAAYMRQRSFIIGDDNCSLTEEQALADVKAGRRIYLEHKSNINRYPPRGAGEIGKALT